ncbi:hypothetical protein NHX12_012696 [Muraenolepis orangiensis]|uniref:MICOS complex subunit MIC25 n=1 Tax=Muraenolepis orangiensis TaxID=630683 RepID=A0A9Q0DDC4_9TELE|nr:hypothetical protein NHX12_012696 [Muraenolepis orangiensis]
MGSGESTTRKVSFGVDDEDRVRILRGVKLTEDVLQRMRGVANIAPNPPSPPTTTASKQQDPASEVKEPGTSSRPSPLPPVQPASSTKTPHTADSRGEQMRYNQQQQILAEELAKVARQEREAAREEMNKVLRAERLLAYHENKKTQQLVRSWQVHNGPKPCLKSHFLVLHRLVVGQ